MSSNFGRSSVMEEMVKKYSTDGMMRAHGWPASGVDETPIQRSGNTSSSRRGLEKEFVQPKF
jgi:hypothetical protein